jgi:hypothetical protein
LDKEPRSSIHRQQSSVRIWYREGDGWLSRPDESSLLPAKLFNLLKPDALDFHMFDHARTYASQEDALAALSNACIEMARIGATSSAESRSSSRRRRRGSNRGARGQEVSTRSSLEAKLKSGGPKEIS